VEVLEPHQIRKITGKKYRPAQMRVLNALGIPVKPRPDGSLLVLASAAEKACAGVIATAKVKQDDEDRFKWSASK
jgi:hypothetical protein